MLDVSLKVSDMDVADLDRSIDLLVKNTNRTIGEAVTFAAQSFLVSAKSGTPKARGKKRKIGGTSAVAGVPYLSHGKKKRGARTAARKYIVVNRQHKKPLFILLPDTTTGTKEQKRVARINKAKILAKWAKKPRIGVSKDSWNRAFSDLGKSTTREAKNRSARIAAASRARRLGGAFTPTINIFSTLSYINKIAPNLIYQQDRAEP